MNFGGQGTVNDTYQVLKSSGRCHFSGSGHSPDLVNRIDVGMIVVMGLHCNPLLSV